MQTTIPTNELKQITSRLSSANADYAQLNPGESPARQPVHTVYGGAHLFKANTAARIGELALTSLKQNAPDPTAFGKALGIDSDLASTVYARVEEKLRREALEDFRIDFEDGYGVRPDAEEDATAVAAAKETALGMKQKSLPPYIGIRIKTLSEELKNRSLRTCDLYITTLLSESGGKLPDNFVVTLPKITHPDHVKALVDVFEVMERGLKLAAGSLKMEFMIETPQSVFDAEGRCALPEMVRNAKGRVVAAHFGTYDYTASLNITADHQVMDHPSCDFARHVMKVNLASTGIWLSDGATNVMPVGLHKNPANAREEAENRASVHQAWRLSFAHIQHSLRHAYYQGWDLHPAQLPVRYAALYTFFLKGLKPASLRLKNFIDQAAKATLVGDIFDDAATGQGLLNYFLRALNCGAITEQEVLATGLTIEEIRLRSFKKILEGRTKR
jgi:citrate lyase beta subunit